MKVSSRIPFSNKKEKNFESIETKFFDLHFFSRFLNIYNWQ